MEDMILFYSELSPEERRTVEHYVAEHPEMQPLLDEAKAFAALVGEAQLLNADPPGDEALAYYIATRHVSPHPVSAPLDARFAEVEAQLAGEASLRTRYAELVRRIAVLEASTDPVQQFERLSGHRLPRTPHDAPAAEEATSAEAAVPRRRATIHRLWRQGGRWAAAAMLFGLAVYGSLGLVSHFSQSDLDRLATLSPATFQTQDFQMRGGDPVPNYVSSDDLYNRALPLLREARTHTLGLFPHYDQATLREAADLLQRVVDQEDGGSALRSEAYFLLAKIRLAQKNVDGARAALHAVLDGSGWKAPEAQALLDDLKEMSK